MPLSIDPLDREKETLCCFGGKKERKADIADSSDEKEQETVDGSWCTMVYRNNWKTVQFRSEPVRLIWPRKKSSARLNCHLARSHKKIITSEPDKRVNQSAPKIAKKNSPLFLSTFQF